MSGCAQTTRNVLMVRPRAFGANVETASTNEFQRFVPPGNGAVHGAAVAEFDAVAGMLRAASVNPIVVEDTDEPSKPDAVFPNNWVSFHADGTAVLYPMMALNRRPERRSDLLVVLAERHGFRVDRVVDLSPLESRGWFLEGTGSLVFDRVNGVAYAGRSARTHPSALEEFRRRLGMEVIAFDTRGLGSRPLFHTNVMLSLGRSVAVICADAIPDAEERRRVLQCLEATGREIVVITLQQVRAFAGNVLELDAGENGRLLALSATAQSALEEKQWMALQSHARPLPVKLPVIERYGGGSIRCMLAEVFLPRIGTGAT